MVVFLILVVGLLGQGNACQHRVTVRSSSVLNPRQFQYALVMIPEVAPPAGQSADSYVRTTYYVMQVAYGYVVTTVE
jgi:hypothetical protein